MARATVARGPPRRNDRGHAVPSTASQADRSGSEGLSTVARTHELDTAAPSRDRRTDTPRGGPARRRMGHGPVRAIPTVAYNPGMATNRIVVDLGPDEQARLEAESRRRGVDADAVIVELVRALPGPDRQAAMAEALEGLRELRPRMPVISEEAFEEALAASRAELERRAERSLAE